MPHDFFFIGSDTFIFTCTSIDHTYIPCFYRKSSHLACTLSGHGSWVLSVDFAPDKMHFVSSSSDHTVKVWDFAQRNCVHTFKDHHDQVSYKFLGFSLEGYIFR